MQTNNIIVQVKVLICDAHFIQIILFLKKT